MSERVRIAVDLLGGDHAPDVVVDGVLQAAGSDPSLQLLIVGPPDVARSLLDARHAPTEIDVVPASQAIGMNENPARAVRAKRDATVRVAARLVREGAADAMVSAGSTGATMAAAMFTLGRLPGVTRPPLALVIDGAQHPVVLLDIGSTVEADANLLAQFALAGTAYAQVRLGLPEPRVGLLSVGSEDRNGNSVRKEAYDAIDAVLSGLPALFVGNVEGSDVPVGGPADVVVTDGLTGNVLLKGLEGMVARIAHGVAQVADDDNVRKALASATAAFNPDDVGGAILLGVNGVVVVGHGASGPSAVAACIEMAAAAARDGLVEKVGAVLADLVTRRRAAMGLPLERAEAAK